jgi:energy-coupling factor transport system permease protein
MDLLRSLPLGLYLEQPVTWLHRLDARVKIAWLMTFLVTPLLAPIPWRVGIAVGLIGLTLLARIPLRVWRQQMGWVLLFCVLVLGITAVMPDGMAVRHQPRLPTQDLLFLQSPPAKPLPSQKKPWYDPLDLLRSPSPQPSISVTPSPAAKNPWYDPFGLFRSSSSRTSTQSIGAFDPGLEQPKPYRFTLFKQGPVTITRESLKLGIQFSTGFFTLLYSTALFLLTTAPEEITTALEQFFQPLRRWKVPVTEIILTLTLSLRFIPLVLEEVQNLVRSVRTRAINWKKLGMRGAAQIGLTVTDRLLENLFLRAEQIASAMTVRGFTSPNRHRVQWQKLQMRFRDWVALGLLVFVLILRVGMGIDLS